MTDKTVAPAASISINGALSPFGGAAGVMFPAMAKILYYNPLVACAFAQGARDIARVRRLIEQTGSSVSEENVQYYAALMRRPRHIAGALGMMAHWNLSAMNAAVGAANAPCVFIAGANDKAVPPEDAKKAAALAPDGRQILLPGLGHLAHEEAPAMVAGIIQEVASDANIV